MKAARAAAIITGLFVLSRAPRAHAELDTFGVGSGRSGAATITEVGTVVNAYAPLATTVAAGATKLVVGPTAGAGAFQPGDLVLLWQTRGGHATPLVSGDTSALALGATSKTGRYELARVFRVVARPDSTREIELTFPLTTSFDAITSQLVRVPEYSSLTVASAGSIAPLAWNGSIGGVVALFVRGAFQNDGSVDGSARGFRGGHPQRFDAPAPYSRGCAALDGPDPNVVGANPLGGGAPKGEGTDPTSFAESVPSPEPRHYGRGNVGAGGGGGDCANAGGGGGGGAGRGGDGGGSRASDGLRPVGGLGGTATVISSVSTHLTCGGGGGSGHDNERLEDPAREGHGGAVLLVRAKSLVGAGTLVSDGRTITAAPVTDGGSGGGAGGTIVVRTTAASSCTRISARGGRGQDALSQRGGGGGGGGGLVDIRPAPLEPCLLDVSGGAGGTSGNDGVAGATGIASTGAATVADDCSTVTGRCGGCVADAECAGGACDAITHACSNGEPGADASAPDASDASVSDAAAPPSGSDGGAAPPPPSEDDLGGDIEGAGGCNVQSGGRTELWLLATFALVLWRRFRSSRAKRGVAHDNVSAATSASMKTRTFEERNSRLG